MSSATVASPPKSRPPHPAEREFSRGLKWSLIAHVTVFAIILIKSLVFPTKAMLYVPTLRVDIVGLPDVLKKDKMGLAKLPMSEEMAEALKKAEAEAKKVKPQPIVKETKEAKDDTAAPDEMVLKPKAETPTERAKRMKSALARIKSLSKITADDESTGKATALIKGNKISRGTSLSGEAKESPEASYFDSLRNRLQENWALPVWIARQNFSAQVQVYIDARGRLQSFRFTKLSGNAQFDEAVKRTLQQSQPYPVPPKEIVSALMNGILVGFPL